MQVPNKELFDLILRDKGIPPFSYKSYHRYLELKGCEENVEFLSDTILFRLLASSIFVDPIPNTDLADIVKFPEKIPFPKQPESMQLDQYEDTIELVKSQWVELCEKYILPGSPKLISIPNTSTKAIETLLDLGYFHPDQLSEIYTLIYDKLLANDFEAYVEAQKALPNAESDNSSLKSSVRVSERAESDSANPPIPQSENESEANESRASQVTSPNPATEKNHFLSNRVAVAKDHSKSLASATVNSSSSSLPLSAQVNATPDITIDQVLNDLAPAPFSRKDYRIFLQISLSEENLDFLIEVLNYQKSAKKLYPVASRTYAHNMEMFEHASTLPAPSKPDGMEDSAFESELQALKTAALDISNKFLKPNSPQEVNLPSKSLKPMIMLLDTGYFNSEVFQEAFDHIRDMLHQNGFDHFIKAAILAAISVTPPTSHDATKKVVPSSRTAKVSVTEREEKGSHSHNLNTSTKIITSGRSAAASISTRKKSKLGEGAASGKLYFNEARESVSSIAPVAEEEVANIPKQPESYSNEKKVIPSNRSAFTKRIVSSSKNNAIAGTTSELEISENRSSVARNSVTDSSQMPAKAGSEESISPPVSIAESKAGDKGLMQPKIIPSSRSAAAQVMAASHQPSCESLDNSDNKSETRGAEPKIIASGRAAGSRYAGPKSSEIIKETEHDGVAEVKTQKKVMASGRSAVAASGRSATPLASGRAAVPRTARAATPASEPSVPSVAENPAEEESSKERKGLFGFGKKTKT